MLTNQSTLKKVPLTWTPAYNEFGYKEFAYSAIHKANDRRAVRCPGRGRGAWAFKPMAPFTATYYSNGIVPGKP